MSLCDLFFIESNVDDNYSNESNNFNPINWFMSTFMTELIYIFLNVFGGNALWFYWFGKDSFAFNKSYPVSWYVLYIVYSGWIASPSSFYVRFYNTILKIFNCTSEVLPHNSLDVYTQLNEICNTSYEAVTHKVRVVFCALNTYWQTSQKWFKLESHKLHHWVYITFFHIREEKSININQY